MLCLLAQQVWCRTIGAILLMFAAAAVTAGGGGTLATTSRTSAKGSRAWRHGDGQSLVVIRTGPYYPMSGSVARFGAMGGHAQMGPNHQHEWRAPSPGW